VAVCWRPGRRVQDGQLRAFSMARVATQLNIRPNSGNTCPTCCWVAHPVQQPHGAQQVLLFQVHRLGGASPHVWHRGAQSWIQPPASQTGHSDAFAALPP
jgi:hypothetical protein